jgi:transcription termination factor Rho
MKPQESEFERSRQLQILIKLLKEKCQELSEQQRNVTGEVLASVS